MFKGNQHVERQSTPKSPAPREENSRVEGPFEAETQASNETYYKTIIVLLLKCCLCYILSCRENI